MKKIIEYFSKSTAKTITLLLIVLGTVSLSYLSFPNLNTPSLQQIAEESSCTPCTAFYGEGVCLNRWQVNYEKPSCVGEMRIHALLQGGRCTGEDEWCYAIVTPSPTPEQDQKVEPTVFIPTRGPTRATTTKPTNPLTITPRGGDNPEVGSFIEILNNHRKSLNLTELSIHDNLTRAAQWMANDLVTRNTSPSHTDSQGRTPEKRLSDFDYPYSAGENLAYNGPTGKEVFDEWLKSEAHKKNMENPQWKAIGVARSEGKNGWYWTANFGAVRSESDHLEANPTQPEEENNNEKDKSPTNNDELKVQNITLNLALTMPGIGTNTSLGLNNSPNRKTRTFFVQFVNDKDIITKEVETSLSYNNGLFQGELKTSIPEGDYEVKLASDNSLFKTASRIINVTANNTSFTLPAVSLTTGNIANEGSSKNKLDIFDYNALLSCYGGKPCGGISQLSDLNDDGKVDSRDFNILLRGFAVQ